MRVYSAGHNLGVTMFEFWFSPYGRAARADYWYWLMLPAAAIAVFLASLAPVLFGHETADALALGALAIFFLSHSAMSIKRLHDLSMPGWYVIALIVPFVVTGVFIAWPRAVEFGALAQAGHDVKIAVVAVFAAVFAPFAAVLNMIWFRMGKDGVNRYGRDPLYR